MFKPDPHYLFAGKLPVEKLNAQEKTNGAFPLSELGIGLPARVREMTRTDASRLQQLSSFGLTPGCELRVRQRSPAVVIEIGHTTLALDFALAREILVEPLS